MFFFFQIIVGFFEKNKKDIFSKLETTFVEKV